MIEMNIGLVDVIDYLGTFAFAISGIRLASQKEFDLFGAFVVGAITAVGGGTLRDLMLGVNPFWMTRWEYMVITLVALVLFIFFHKHINRVAETIFLFDTIGLALFTVVGYQKTIDAGYAMWAAILMGMFTGAMGGVLRDILINDIPLIFRHDIYAMACLAGGLFYSAGMLVGAPIVVCQLGCAATVVVIRLLAVHYHWQLPIVNKMKG